MKVQSFEGSEIETFNSELANLRTEVLRDFPYLHETTADSEKQYLKSYSTNPLSLLIAVFDEHHKMIGAAAGIPLTATPEYLQAPLLQAGYNPAEIFYFDESLLIHAFRGHGFGHRFFELREQFAIKHGFKMAVFCTIERPEDHPLLPYDFHPLHDFWVNKGFEKRPEIIREASWPDIGQTKISKKLMSYWLKSF